MLRSGSRSSCLIFGSSSATAFSCFWVRLLISWCTLFNWFLNCTFCCGLVACLICCCKLWYELLSAWTGSGANFYFVDNNQEYWDNSLLFYSIRCFRLNDCFSESIAPDPSRGSVRDIFHYHEILLTSRKFLLIQQQKVFKGRISRSERFWVFNNQRCLATKIKTEKSY